MKRIAVMICVLVSVACGTKQPAETAIQKCEDLRSSLCDRALSCLPTGAFLNHTDCTEQLTALLPCAPIKSVTDKYDTCVSQVKTVACATLFPADPGGGVGLAIPADCGMVLVSRQAPAGNAVASPWALSSAAGAIDWSAPEGSDPDDDEATEQ